jgi:hypothetical protein
MGHSFPWRLRRGFLLVLLSAGAAACLHAFNSAERAEPAQSAAAQAAEDVAVEIANHNWLDVIIWVLHDGQSTRVGTANATSSASFSLPARLLGQGREIRLIGHPIGGTRTVMSETFVVQPGQYVEWTLESDLDRSAIGVY